MVSPSFLAEILYFPSFPTSPGKQLQYTITLPRQRGWSQGSAEKPSHPPSSRRTKGTRKGRMGDIVLEKKVHAKLLVVTLGCLGVWGLPGGWEQWRTPGESWAGPRSLSPEVRRTYFSVHTTETSDTSNNFFSRANDVSIEIRRKLSTLYLNQS